MFKFKLLFQHTMNGNRLRFDSNNIYWHLEIKSIEELLAYFDKVYSNKIARNVWDFSGEMVNLKDDSPEYLHKLSKGSMAVYSFALSSKDKHKDIFSIAASYSSYMLNSFIKNLQGASALYFNSAGGYWSLGKNESLDKEYITLKKVTLDNVVFPEYDGTLPTYKVSRWPGGKHWYVKVGDLDVVEGNTRKWNTAKEAEEAGERFIKNLEDGIKA